MRLIGLAVMLTLNLTLAPLAVEAQQADKVYRIAWLGNTPWPPNDPRREVFNRAMRHAGWVEGQNFILDRRAFIATSTLGILAAPRAFAQEQPARIARIGFLGVTSASLSDSVIRRVEALRTGLRDLGYVEGKNLTIEFRWAEGRHERLPELAAELVRLKVDVIVAQGTPGARAAKQATATIPIVIPAVANPVATELVASLARPGGNVTGLTWLSFEVSAKRLELLREAFPRTKRVAVLINPHNASNASILEAMELAARSLKLDIQQFEARGPNEFERAFTAMAAKRVDAITIIDDPMLNANTKAIANLAAKNRLPSIAYLSSRMPAGSCPTARASWTCGGAPPPTWTRSSRAPSRATCPSSSQRGSSWSSTSRPPRRSG